MIVTPLVTTLGIAAVLGGCLGFVLGVIYEIERVRGEIKLK